MSALVTTDKPQSEQIESVLPPIADIERTFRDIDRMGATERGARVKPERDRHRQEAADEGHFAGAEPAQGVCLRANVTAGFAGRA